MTQLQSDTIGKLASALVKAQATMGVALKDSTNPHFKSKYADLASIINAAREPLADNGLAVVQRAHPNDRGVQLETTIIHESGEWITDGGLFLPATKLDPQAFGSAITYARRYAYAAMLGIVQDDDDGAQAVAAQQAAREKAQRAANAPKLNGQQLACLEAISAAAGHPGKDRSDIIAEDYPKVVHAAVGYAHKQGVVGDNAEIVEAAALELDVAGVTAELAAVPA